MTQALLDAIESRLSVLNPSIERKRKELRKMDERANKLKTEIEAELAERDSLNAEDRRLRNP